MTIYTLSHGSLKLDVSDQGGVIEGFWRDTTPLLRPGKKSGVATDASCFPLVPFANRVSGNRFVWQGREYQLQFIEILTDVYLEDYKRANSKREPKG